MRLIIYTDGASRGNPGKASYGFLIKGSSGEILYSEGKFLGIATNNFAEYSAVLSAYEYIKQKWDGKITELNFFMDSKLVVEQLSGRFRVKSENLKPLIYEIKKNESLFSRVAYKHVPRRLNSEADAIANKALDNLNYQV
ncbi:ribonuclease HI family protein [Candidatus Daviesbacteria bacterium]|nr:ribonuclease HI family protein [Candidatus Daviesbacteria bacterium]